MGLFVNSLMLTIAISISLMVFSVDAPQSCLSYNSFFNVGTNSISANQNFTASIPNDVTNGGFFSGVGNAISSFIDIVAFGLKFFFFFTTRILFASLTCGSSLGMPIWMQLLLSLPAFFMCMGLVLKRIGMGDN